MQVSQLNDVNVYNLSSGKSLPEWLSDRKKRQLLKQDVDVRRRIELIQEFTMPTASSSIKVTNDGNYILASGVYKPRIKCYDVNQLSLKFERCFDANAVKFEMLSDDYSKLVLLQSDRYVEFHSQPGRYYRTRIPKFGRDLCYHSPSCDLYFVGAGPEVIRLNLEQGRFLEPFMTTSPELNVCSINPAHQLLAVGTIHGKIECFDPRSKSRIAALDVADPQTSGGIFDQIPSVTALSFRDGLYMGVGVSSGHVLLYDIRSPKPVLVKDHNYGMPIKNVIFHDKSDTVISSDCKAVRIWDRQSGEIFTSIEPEAPINDVCVFPQSGLLFLANEAEKMGIFYIPELGPAPQWCGFLDSLTEELEESNTNMIYDDYKFVTKQELDNFGLSHLVGTNMLRAYMHGYFMDMKLYHQVKSLVDPFAYENYRKNKIKSKIEEDRANRFKAKKLPKVNKDLAEKLMQEADDIKSSKMPATSNALDDKRFSALFDNPDYEIDEDSEQFKLLHPVLSKHEKDRRQKRSESYLQLDDRPDLKWQAASEDDDNNDDEAERSNRKKSNPEPKLIEFDKEKFKDFSLKSKSKASKMKRNKTLSDMLDEKTKHEVIREKGTALGSKEVTFKLGKTVKQLKDDEEELKHKIERKTLRRSAGALTSQTKQEPKYWRGKRVK